MEEKAGLSIKGKPSNKGLNLLLAALLTFFLINLALPLIQGNWTDAIDYVAFYNAGGMVNEGRFADIYDLEKLRARETELLLSLDGQVETDFVVNPIQYLPIFILPFSLLARLDFPISLWVWQVVNLVGLVGYLWFFARKASGKTSLLQVVLLFLVSLPVLLNFHYGQVNVWLLICVGEFLRATQDKKPYAAGLWLGGLLIKPHLLILLLPFLLIQKRYKEILGFGLSALIVMGLSFVLVGVDGFIALKDVMFEAAQGGVSSGYEYMMNWRMVSHYVEMFSSPLVGRAVLIALMVITAGLPLVIFRKKIAADSPRFAVAVLGVLAATTAVTYHIHVHTAMILIPVLLYLSERGQINPKWVRGWSIGPILFYFFQYILAVLLLQGILPEAFAVLGQISYGMGMLVVNMMLLGWTFRQRERIDQEPTTDQDGQQPAA
jgi:hypothetical protein